MPDDIRRQELARYLAGTASPEEAERVREWLETHPEARVQLDGLGGLSPEDAERRDPAMALARMHARMAEEDRPRRQREERGRIDRAPVARLQRAWVPVLGVIVLLIAAGLWLYLALPGEPEMRSIATAPGEQRTVTLDDGTVVQLNVASRLRVSETFGVEHREVQLEGEAYFDVATDSLRPFVVRSGEAAVQVLGTAFGVEAYEERRVEVVVVVGRVALREHVGPEASATVLAPGELGRLVHGPDGASRVEVERVRPGSYLAWREGRLVFEGTPLSEAARTLERWYDVEVVLADELDPTRRLDASFGEEPLTDVLRTIAAALEITYTIDGRRVLLMPGR